MRWMWILIACACATDLVDQDAGIPDAADAMPLLDAGHFCTTFNGLLIPERTIVADEQGCNVCTCWVPSDRGPELGCTGAYCQYFDPGFVPPANNPEFPWCDSQDECVVTYPGFALDAGSPGMPEPRIVEGACLFDPGCGQRGRCIFTAHCQPRDEEPRVSAEGGWCGCDGRVYSGCPIAEWTGQYTDGTRACGN
jgi:hypothetical protein